MHVRRLTMTDHYSPKCVIAMDETAVWSDMVGNTTVNATVTNDIALNSTGNKKVRVSIYLAAKKHGRR